MLTVKAEALGTSSHCRICRQNVDFDFPHKNLFDNYFEIESSESLSLIEVARNLLDLPFERKPELSDKICLDCHHKIIDFYKFKRNARKTAENLTQNESTPVTVKLEIDDVEMFNEMPPQFLEEIKVESLEEEKKDESESDNLYSCERCGVQLKTLRKLNSHQLTCENRNFYSCEYCKEDFVYNTNLQKHIVKCKYFIQKTYKKIRTSDAAKNFVCIYCKKDFPNEDQSDKTAFSKHKNRCRQQNKVRIIPKSENSSEAKIETPKSAKNLICIDSSKDFPNRGRSDTVKFLKHREESRKKPNAKSVACNLCNKVLATQTKLQKHLQICRKNDSEVSAMSVECEYCKEKFPTHTKVLHRRFITHKTSCKKKYFPELYSFSCQFCKNVFQSDYNLKVHQSMCLSNPKFERDHCLRCQSKFKSLMSLKKHLQVCCPDDEILQKAHPRDVKKCFFCNKTFDSQNHHRFKNHCDMHKACQFLMEKNVFTFNECGRCQKSYADQKSLANHVCEPRGDNSKFDCSQCNIQYDTIQSLKEHFVFFHLNLFVCPMPDCLIEKNSYSIFYYHLQKSHPGFISCINSFPCDYCQTDFSSYYLLERHRKNEVCSAKNYICDHCGKFYGHRRELVSHFQFVFKKYICSFCGKVCSDGTALSSHVRVHTGERPFPCKICDKKFMTSSALLTHIKIHSNKKIFQCQFCDYKSNTSRTLRKHVYLHTQRHQCPVCNNLLSTRFAISTHLKSVHQITDLTDLQKMMQNIKVIQIEPESLRRRRN